MRFRLRFCRLGKQQQPTAANLLTKSFGELRLEPVASPLATVEQRKHRVILDFAEKNWQPFMEVSVTLTIVTFVLEAAVGPLDLKGNQVHTRSLHAEENAFLQISKYGGAAIEGGILFSTASPCELCSKKAYQLGIKRIFYIDPYPGISLSHILGAGPADRRPQFEVPSVFRLPTGRAHAAMDC